jgi:hypothetical protein
VVVGRRSLTAAAIAAVALAVGAWLLGHSLISSPARGKAPARSSSGFVAYAGPGRAFVGAYPASWRRLPSTDPEVVILASGGNGASFQIRVTPLDGPVGVANLASVKGLTDRVVRSGASIRFLRAAQQVTLGGLPGYLYLYTYKDPVTGLIGAHAHYFLFRGSTMITIVFQATPANRIYALAPQFDRIAGSFRPLPS